MKGIAAGWLGECRGLFICRRLLFRRRERCGHGNVAHLSVEFSGDQPRASLGPVLGRKLEVSVHGPRGQDSQHAADVGFGVELVKPAIQLGG